MPSGSDPAIDEAVSAVLRCLDTAGWFALHDSLTRLHRGDGASFRTRTVLEGLLAEIRLRVSDTAVRSAVD